jgi:hypothetical protein
MNRRNFLTTATSAAIAAGFLPRGTSAQQVEADNSDPMVRLQDMVYKVRARLKQEIENASRQGKIPFVMVGDTHSEKIPTLMQYIIAESLVEFTNKGPFPNRALLCIEPGRPVDEPLDLKFYFN